MVTNSGRKWPESWKVFWRSIIENIYKRFIDLWNVCKHVSIHVYAYIYMYVCLREWARDVHRKHDGATVSKFSDWLRRRIASFADFTAITSFTDWNIEFFADSSLESSLKYSELLPPSQPVALITGSNKGYYPLESNAKVCACELGIDSK